MARTGVNYFDIAQAAEAIRHRGEEPTVDRVREELGTGSKSTIAPLLKRWKAETGGAKSDSGGLPQDLLDALKGLRQRVQEEADRKIDAVREESAETVEQVNAELAQLRLVLTERSTNLQTLEQKLESSEKANRTLQQALDEAQKALTKSEYQREEGSARISELRTSLDELKHENRTVRDHFEHFQQRIADDRQQERDQFRQTNGQLTSQIARLDEQLATAGQRLDDRELRLAEMDARNVQQLSELQLAQQTLTAERAELESLRQGFDRQGEKLQESVAEVGGLRAQIASLASSNEAYIRESGLLRDASQKHEAEIERQRETLASLSKEHQVALEQKAELKGQLAQLERALKVPVA